MALYANIRNPLTVNNRAELVRFYEKNIDGYKDARENINDIDSEYEQKYENAEASEDEEYSKLWNDRKQGTITEEEYQKAINLMSWKKNGVIKRMRQVKRQSRLLMTISEPVIMTA